MTTAEMNDAMSAPCANCSNPADTCTCFDNLAPEFPGYITPAYGRSYTSCQQVVDALMANKDFYYYSIVSTPTEAYLSIRDLRTFSCVEFHDYRTGFSCLVNLVNVVAAMKGAAK